jgi:hypothetical protein
MAIIRRHHNSNFTVIPNVIFEDSRLSIEAKGALGYLLSRPHDWLVRLAHLGRALGVGRDKMERIIGELIAAGYVLRRGQQRTQSQQWGAADYVVMDHPVQVDASLPPIAPNAPCPENPHTGEPHAGNQGTYQEVSLQNAAADARTRKPTKSLITPEAFALADVLIRLQRLDGDDPRSVAVPYTVQLWLSKGWRAKVIQQAVEVVMARRTEPPKSLRYFEGPIAEAHAELDRPLPVATVNPKNKSQRVSNGTAYRANQHGGGSISTAARNLRERFEIQAAELERREANGMDYEPDRSDDVCLPSR